MKNPVLWTSHLAGNTAGQHLSALLNYITPRRGSVLHPVSTTQNPWNTWHTWESNGRLAFCLFQTKPLCRRSLFCVHLPLWELLEMLRGLGRLLVCFQKFMLTYMCLVTSSLVGKDLKNDNGFPHTGAFYLSFLMVSASALTTTMRMSMHLIEKTWSSTRPHASNAPAPVNMTRMQVFGLHENLATALPPCWLSLLTWLPCDSRGRFYLKQLCLSRCKSCRKLAKMNCSAFVVVW